MELGVTSVTAVLVSRKMGGSTGWWRATRLEAAARDCSNAPRGQRNRMRSIWGGCQMFAIGSLEQGPPGAQDVIDGVATDTTAWWAAVVAYA